MALVFVGLGIAMILHPDLVIEIENGDVPLRRGSGLLSILNVVWSKPGGIVLIVLSFFLGIGGFMMDSDSETGRDSYS